MNLNLLLVCYDVHRPITFPVKSVNRKISFVLMLQRLPAQAVLVADCQKPTRPVFFENAAHSIIPVRCPAPSTSHNSVTSHKCCTSVHVPGIEPYGQQVQVHRCQAVFRRHVSPLSADPIQSPIHSPVDDQTITHNLQP